MNMRSLSTSLGICLLLPFGMAMPTAALGLASLGVDLDSICSQLSPAANPPQQSRPVTAKSCAACHSTTVPSVVDVRSGAFLGSTNSIDLCINTAPGEATINTPAVDNTTVTPGGKIVFAGQGNDPDGFDLTYNWSFSNGSRLTGQTVELTVPASADSGTVAGTLTIADPNGATAATQPTRTVTVTGSNDTNITNSYVYVTNYYFNTVTLINATNSEVLDSLTVEGRPFGQAVSRDGKYAYLIYPNGNLPNGSVSVIDPKTHQVTAKASFDNSLSSVAVTPDGKFSYSTNFSTEGKVIVRDTATGLVSSLITVGSYPTGIAITASGGTAYVANSLDGTVSVINTSDNKVSKTLRVGAYPFSVGIIPDTPATTFAEFKVIDFGLSPWLGSLSLSADFTLGLGSVGIAPKLQNTFLQIDGFSFTIPGGAFWPVAGGYRLSGSIQGMYVDAQIRRLSPRQYHYELYVYQVDLTGINNPAKVQLTIGGDSGVATATPRYYP